MLERISELISNVTLKSITSTSEVVLIDFSIESNKLKTKILGSNYNFNYELKQFSLNYLLPSLTSKPYQEYKLTDTEAARRAADVEFARTHNELNGYATKVTIFLTQFSTGVRNTVGEVLIYGYPITMQLPLLQYLNSSVMSDDCRLSVVVSRYRTGDKLIFSCAYTGNVNYTFDSGNQSHVFL